MENLEVTTFEHAISIGNSAGSCLVFDSQLNDLIVALQAIARDRQSRAGGAESLHLHRKLSDEMLHYQFQHDYPSGA